MAQLQVRLVDKGNPDDPVADLKCFKRGDVISLVEDAHVWSDLEFGETDERVIIFADGVDAADLTAFLAPTYDVDGALVKPRARRFDLDTWQANGTPVLDKAGALALLIDKA